MDNTNTQVDVNDLTADLTALADELNLKETVRAQIFKSEIEKIDGSSSPLSDEVETDESDDLAIAEIEAYADEQLAQFDSQVDTALKEVEEEDIASDATIVEDKIEGEDDLESLIK